MDGRQIESLSRGGWTMFCIKQSRVPVGANKGVPPTLQLGLCFDGFLQLVPLLLQPSNTVVVCVFKIITSSDQNAVRRPFHLIVLHEHVGVLVKSALGSVLSLTFSRQQLGFTFIVLEFLANRLYICIFVLVVSPIDALVRVFDVRYPTDGAPASLLTALARLVSVD